VEAHSLFVGSRCEDERVFDLGLWHVQKGICSSLCLHNRKPKKISRTESGFFKKNSHPIKLIAKKLACPLSPNSMLLHRFASKGLQKNSHFGSDAGMHWATTLIKGARWLVFFANPVSNPIFLFFKY
jgi:hypothetical protein